MPLAARMALTGPEFGMAMSALADRAELEHEADARLDLFDVAGRRVRSDGLGALPAGASTVAIPAAWSQGLSSGVYVARLSAGRMRNECRVTRVAD